ncbi:hypothetical protein HMPREF1254_1514 [Prevotella sp. BV3P1]|nr:hypothetical protein HMPREF1254_1514 [Prevotella sp. BV3P1]
MNACVHRALLRFVPIMGFNVKTIAPQNYRQLVSHPQNVYYFYQIMPQKRHLKTFKIEKINRSAGCK